MSDEIRLLYRDGRATNAPDIPGHGAPRGTSKDSLIARNQIAEFLDATLIRPLHFDEQQQMTRVERSLDTMTIPERIAIEIEMTRRSRAMHSFDYDPLR